MKIENLKKGDYILVKCKVEAVFVDGGMVMVTTKDCDEGFDAYIDEIVEKERPTVEPDDVDGKKATQIGDILVKAYNSGLLTICGGMFDDKEVGECYNALMDTFKMLKTDTSQKGSTE